MQVIHVGARSDVNVFIFNAVILSLLIIFLLFLDFYKSADRSFEKSYLI